jgi:flagellar biogenesis protein FliO
MTDLPVRIALALGAVVGMILIFGFLLRKRQTKPGLLHIIAYRSFGPRKGIAAMKIGKEVLIIGVTSTDLKLLKTCHENDIETDLVQHISDKVSSLRNLRERLNEPS